MYSVFVKKNLFAIMFLFSTVRGCTFWMYRRIIKLDDRAIKTKKKKFCAFKIKTLLKERFTTVKPIYRTVLVISGMRSASAYNEDLSALLR